MNNPGKGRIPLMMFYNFIQMEKRRMKRLNNRLFWIINFSLLWLVQCAKLPGSVGKSRDVVVVGSLLDTTFIINNLQIYNYMPQKEPTFIFIFVPDTMLKNVKQFHSLFLCGSLKDEFINTLLNLEAREATKKDTFLLFKINDLWAKDQTVTILAVSEPHYLLSGILKYKRIIAKILEENYYRKIKKQYYEKGIDRRMKKTLAHFGIEMDFPENWMIDSTNKSENFIFIHTHYPDRSIFFYREKRTGELDDSLAIKKRNEITKKFYNGDYILKDLTIAEKIVFQGMSGLKLKGVWQNDSLVAGGPFLTYFFNKNDSLYIIDGILFLPGERKTDYFTTLEVIMNSFKLR